MGESTRHTINKRTRAREALARDCAREKTGGKPKEKESFGDRIAHDIAVVVEAATSRPPGALPVDAKGGISGIEVLRTPSTGKRED